MNYIKWLTLILKGAVGLPYSEQEKWWLLAYDLKKGTVMPAPGASAEIAYSRIDFEGGAYFEFYIDDTDNPWKITRVVYVNPTDVVRHVEVGPADKPILPREALRTNTSINRPIPRNRQPAADVEIRVW